MLNLKRSLLLKQDHKCVCHVQSQHTVHATETNSKRHSFLSIAPRKVRGFVFMIMKLKFKKKNKKNFKDKEEGGGGHIKE